MIFPALAVFLFGLLIGSFLNVCIYRMPRGESVVWPGSRCPACRKSIAWYDNIPVIGYLILGGKCRFCRAPIALRYPVIEIVTGLAWMALWLFYGWTPKFGAGLFLFSILIAVMVTDWETGFIPDGLTLPGLLAGIALSAAFPSMHNAAAVTDGFLSSFIGVLAGGGLLWLTGWIGTIIFRKDSLGGGDIKLLAMMGAYLGVAKVLLVFFLAPFFALPIALYTRFVIKVETIPFGPYLALAGMVLFLFGDRIVPVFFII